MRVLSSIETLVYLVATLFGGYRAVQEIRISATEKAPTEFAAGDFAQKYDGQQWVRVVGRLAVEHRHVRQSNYEAHKGKNLCYVNVPVVGPQWQPAEEVVVLATYGPMPRPQVEGWARGMEGLVRPVEGQLRPGGFRDPAGMFPGLTVSPKFVTINDGTEPNNMPSMLFFLGLMVVFGLLLLRKLRIEFTQEEDEELAAA